MISLCRLAVLNRPPHENIDPSALEREIGLLLFRVKSGQPKSTNLMRLLEADPANPRHLLTVWGVGYRFEP